MMKKGFRAESADGALMPRRSFYASPNPRRKRRLSVGQLLIILFFSLFVITIAWPLFNLVARSFATPEAATAMKGYDLLPAALSFVHYEIVFKNPVIYRGALNQAYITVVGTLINIVLTTVAAYVMTRPNLVGKRLLSVFFIFMMLFSPGTVPEYLVMKDLHLINSHWSVILISAVNVYYMFILMRFIGEIPESLMEAAIIDGAGHLRVIRSVVLPLAQAGILTVGMFYAVSRWNEFFRASIYINSISKTTLQVIIRQFVVASDVSFLIGSSEMTSYSELARVNFSALKSAAVLTSILPILFIYPFVLKYYRQDVMVGGVKG